MIEHLLESSFIYGGFLLWLEGTFVLVSLLILFSLKRTIGTAPLYLTVGILLVFAHLTAAAQIQLFTTQQGLAADISTASIILPCLALLLTVYIVDGTLSAQRLIIAVMAGFGMFIYSRSIVILQCSWTGSSIVNGGLAEYLQKLLEDTGRHMGTSTIAITLNLFIIPMVYQKLRNNRCSLFLCLASSLICGQLINSLFISFLQIWGSANLFGAISRQLFPQTMIALWLAVLLTVYLARMEKESADKRGALDIFFAFFGAYGKAKLLEQNLHESEQRYRTIIQNAGDLILVTDSSGVIVDANQAALQIFSFKRIADAVGTSLHTVVPDFPDLESIEKKNMIHLKIAGNTIELELVVNKVFIGGTPAYVLIGRDITERERLARERDAWRSENAHRQRLEAIGRLAGGIAHDFNNHLHAILGNLDLIYMEGAPKDLMPHLEKIDAISQQAAKLTGQLLGYARKGRRLNVKVNINTLMKDSLELFMPESRAGVNLNVQLCKEDLYILGDPTQIQQAVLNLLINAKDAVQEYPEDERVISVQTGSVKNMNLKLHPPAEIHLMDFGKMCVIRIADTGKGVPPEILEKIFEPFFTTKPTGKGTGMGLSMAYGVLLEHGGWIQYDPAENHGAVFSLILPLENPDREPDAAEKASSTP